MKLSILIALFMLARASICSAADEPELAVVVAKAISIDTLSSSELRLMIMGEKSKWPNGTAVIPVQTPPESPGKALQLKAVNKMTDAALKRYYMLAVFNGKEIAPPRDLASAEALKKYVASNPGAIGCILVSDVDDSVKVLKVDGAAPGEPGYKLH
jgi:hypothetical protein